MSAPGVTMIDRIRRQLGRAAFRAVVTGLSGGMALHLLHQPAASQLVLTWTCGLLIALPIVNVLWVLVDELRRRDWGFSLLAVAVLALLACALASRLLPIP